MRLAAATEANDGRDAFARRRDLWLNRDVVVLPLENAELARARAFARAGHAALPTILRVDLTAGEIWIAPPKGHALADEPRALTKGERARVAEAIAALHAAGGGHGRIDAQHLYLHDGDIALAYPHEAGKSDEIDEIEAAKRDLAALSELGESALDGA